MFIQLGESKTRLSYDEDELDEFKDVLGESVEDGLEMLVEGEPVELLLGATRGVGVGVYREGHGLGGLVGQPDESGQLES